MVSLPLPPERLSLPLPPSMTSSPSPPTIASSPGTPLRMSLPLDPPIRSLPPPPSTTKETSRFFESGGEGFASRILLGDRNLVGGNRIAAALAVDDDLNDGVRELMVL